MRAITVCNPHAHLIRIGEKRVENRGWRTHYRGPLYIHAGMGRAFWKPGVHAKLYPNVAWGAVVATAELVECAPLGDIQAGKYDEAFPWLRTHAHVEGAWCWVLDAVVAVGPWPWRGSQGFFDIDEEELGRVANRVLAGDAKR